MDPFSIFESWIMTDMTALVMYHNIERYTFYVFLGVIACTSGILVQRVLFHVYCILLLTFHIAFHLTFYSTVAFHMHIVSLPLAPLYTYRLVTFWEHMYIYCISSLSSKFRVI